MWLWGGVGAWAEPLMSSWAQVGSKIQNNRATAPNFCETSVFPKCYQMLLEGQ